MVGIDEGFGTFTRDPLPDQIANRIVGLIAERRLVPGERLPPERELALTMGVSRSSLREALRALAMIGVTEMRHGHGTYVTALEPATMMRPLGLVLALSDTGFEELFEARRLVEPPLAGLAAERADAATLAALARCAEASAATVDDDDAFMRVDLELHNLISEAARNAILARLVDSIGELAIASRITTTRIPDLREQAARDHHRIVEAIAARDPQAASAAMLEHLENVERLRLAAREDEAGA
jgi:GntR family transcriptional regulator, transcriptional repressor for pyruvate dehydrogenase complex